MAEIFSGDNEGRPTTRHFFAQELFMAECENYFDFEYDNYHVWAENCLYNGMLEPYQGPDAALVLVNTDGTAGESGLWSSCTDLAEIDNGNGDEQNEVYLDYGASPAADYCLKMYDRTDGKKVMVLCGCLSSLRPICDYSMDRRRRI